MSDIYIGNVVRLSAVFTNAAEAATNPTAVVLKIQKPDGTSENDITPTNDSTGNYHYDYTPATAGKYYYKFIGTGIIVAVEESFFYTKGTKIT